MKSVLSLLLVCALGGICSARPTMAIRIFVELTATSFGKPRAINLEPFAHSVAIIKHRK
jgi:hypothetical protein